MFRVEIAEIAPRHKARRVIVVKHPKHKVRRQVGICGMTWEDGWSLLNDHDLTSSQAKEVGRKLRALMNGEVAQ